MYNRFSLPTGWGKINLTRGETYPRCPVSFSLPPPSPPYRGAQYCTVPCGMPHVRAQAGIKGTRDMPKAKKKGGGGRRRNPRGKLCRRPFVGRTANFSGGPSPPLHPAMVLPSLMAAFLHGRVFALRNQGKEDVMKKKRNSFHARMNLCGQHVF